MTRSLRWAWSVLAKASGLAVDDKPPALATVASLLFCWLVMPHLSAGGTWTGPILVTGLAIILPGSTLRPVARRR